MYLLDRSANPPSPVEVMIEPVTESDLETLTPEDYYFNWKDFEKTELWKIRRVNSKDILGAMSLTSVPSDARIEVNLICSRRDNVGSQKQYDRIVGCLLSWAGRLAVKEHGHLACISLIPKTRLIKHYQNKYGMLRAGQQLFLEGIPLYRLIQTYIYNEP